MDKMMDNSSQGVDINRFGQNSGSEALLDPSHSNSVLIIDDDKWIHRVISSYLHTYNINTYSAYDPVEGIAFAINKKPMLILLDIVMPQIKGDMLLRIMKKVDATSHIPIIILSGNLNKDLLGKTYRDGASGFITKPFSQTVLVDKMLEVLPQELSNKFGLLNSGGFNPG